MNSITLVAFASWNIGIRVSRASSAVLALSWRYSLFSMKTTVLYLRSQQNGCPLRLLGYSTWPIKDPFCSYLKHCALESTIDAMKASMRLQVTPDRKSAKVAHGLVSRSSEALSVLDRGLHSFGPCVVLKHTDRGGTSR